MKSKIFLLMVVLMLMVMVGCDSDSNNSNNVATNTTPEPTEVAEETVPEGTELLDIDFSGMTESEVNEELDSIEEKLSTSVITVVSDNNTNEYRYTLADLGITYNSEDSVDDLMNGIKPDFIEYNQDTIAQAVDYIATSEVVPFTNASMTRSGGAFTITEGSDGLAVDTELLTNDLVNSLDLVNPTVTLSYVATSPEYVAADLQNSQDLLGSSTTNYSGSDSSNRTTNMIVASNGLNGTIAYPGESVSTNAQFKSRVYANGYVDAPGISNGELVDGVGGGICQVSSTLYNSVIKSELAIDTRTNHSLKVGYLPYAYDCTLVDGVIDFVFTNNTDSPIYIASNVSNGVVTVNIYGNETRPSNRTISFTNEFISSTPYEIEEIEDPELPAGTTEYDITPLNGQKYALYKNIYIDGVLQDTVLVNTSNYKVRNGVLRVGTGEALPSEEPEETIAPTVAPTENIEPTVAPTIEPTETETTVEPTVAPSEDITTETTEEPIIIEETAEPTVNDTTEEVTEPIIVPSEEAETIEETPTEDEPIIIEEEPTEETTAPVESDEPVLISSEDD